MVREDKQSQERFPCPFYGFGFAAGLFIDSSGNQCGLKVDSHSPCAMEIYGKSPNWEGCPFYNQSTLEFMGNTPIFPREISTSVRLSDWTRFVVDKEPLPIEV